MAGEPTMITILHLRLDLVIEVLLLRHLLLLIVLLLLHLLELVWVLKHHGGIWLLWDWLLLCLLRPI